MEKQLLTKPFIKNKKSIVKTIGVREDSYIVDNIGRVYNKKTGKEISPQIINSGYEIFTLVGSDKKYKKVLKHRLVAEHFVENPDPNTKITVNHINGNKSINSENNLEWVTQKENNIHARENNLNMAYGEYHYNTNLNNVQVEYICKLLENNLSYSDILKHLNIEITDNNIEIIGNIKRGRTWKHISCNYNITQEKYYNYTYSIDIIHKMCEYIKNDKSIPEIYNLLFLDTYVNSRVNKQYYEFIRRLKNKEHFTDISNNYF